MTEDARRLLDEHVQASLRQSPLDGVERTEAYHELRSHVHEAAREQASSAGARAIEVVHVEAAIEASQGVGKGIAARGAAWTLRLPQTPRGRLALAAAAAATVLLVAHAVAGACTDRPGCVPPAFTIVLLAAGSAGLVGALAGVRWPAFVATLVLAAALALSESLSPLVASATLLLLASGAAVPRRQTPWPSLDLRRYRKMGWFFLLGLAAPSLTELVVDEALGIHTQGAAQELGTPAATALVLSVLVALAVGERSPGFIAMAIAVAMAGTVVGFLAYFALGTMGGHATAVGGAGVARSRAGATVVDFL